MAVVLVVDDEPSVREVLRRWIEGAGHDVFEAGDAEHALKVMEECRAALAFCDIQMPGHDGIWLTRRLRQRFPLSAVVLATTVTSVPPAVSMQYGVLAYIIKPLDKARVIGALEIALKWHADAVVAGPKPEDTGDRLSKWLDALEY